ncbi:hypothetical protein SAMN05444146_5225 [Flavobacterium johnsoniae]|nr:hypothetical protein SAMN05444146_5225 [Flavobacterium johnsoniae]
MIFYYFGDKATEALSSPVLSQGRYERLPVNIKMHF